MRYKPRHPVLNLICAVGCCLLGLVLVFCGIADIDRPRFWISSWGFPRFSSEYGIYWGCLWTILGAVGVYYHVRYFRDKKRNDKKHKRDDA